MSMTLSAYRFVKKNEALQHELEAAVEDRERTKAESEATIARLGAQIEARQEAEAKAEAERVEAAEAEAERVATELPRKAEAARAKAELLRKAEAKAETERAEATEAEAKRAEAELLRKASEEEKRAVAVMKLLLLLLALLIGVVTLGIFSVEYHPISFKVISALPRSCLYKLLSVESHPWCYLLSVHCASGLSARHHPRSYLAHQPVAEVRPPDRLLRVYFLHLLQGEY